MLKKLYKKRSNNVIFVYVLKKCLSYENKNNNHISLHITGGIKKRFQKENNNMCKQNGHSISLSEINCAALTGHVHGNAGKWLQTQRLLNLIPPRLHQATKQFKDFFDFVCFCLKKWKTNKLLNKM